MRLFKLYTAIPVLGVLLLASACAPVVQTGDDNISASCTGSCDNFTVGGSGRTLASSEPEYGPVSSDRVGSQPSLIHMLGGDKPMPKAKTKKSPKPAWYAWWAKRTNVSRADLAKAFETDDRKLLRVPTSAFIQSIGALGVPVPQEQKAFAEFIGSSDRVKEVDCTAELLAGYNMSRSSKDGKNVDMDWSRKSCYKGEKFLVYVHDDKSEQAFLSLGCGNVLTPKPKMEKLTNRLPTVGGASFTLAASTSVNHGCPREENGPFMELARAKLGEEVALVTHCVLRPVGPAEGVSWTAEDRRKYGVASRWKRLVSDGVLVGKPTETAYRFSEMGVKRGERVRFITFPSGNFFEAEAVIDGVVEVPSNLVTSPDGRTVIAYPQRIVTEESVMKWRTNGVDMCYPSSGDDNYTRGPKNGKPGELFQTVGRGKNFTVNFSVVCGDSA